jgi:phosphatidate cytidylyltransferase
MAMMCLCVALAAIYPSAFGLGNAFPEAAWRLGRWFYLPAATFWLLVVPLWMKQRWTLPKSILGLLVGLVVILPAWLALVQLKHVGGELALILIMATVWLADIAAYAFGRNFGRHKLAPSISPGKTWEGAMGGCMAVVVYGFVLSPRLPSVLADHEVLLFSTLLLLSVISVLGDLFESLLKRQVGLKDSSNILPGHGGILDRIDSLTSTLPLVALVWLATVY